MIILRDSFDPIMIDHLEIIKKYKKLGLYIDDKGLTDKNIRLKLAKKMIKPYHHVKIVNEIKDDDQIITSNFTDSYQKIYEGKLYLLPKKIRYDVLKSDEYLKKIVSNCLSLTKFSNTSPGIISSSFKLFSSRYLLTIFLNCLLLRFRF